MSVLDTFYILFKTNADDVKRGMDVVNKVAKETEEKLKNTNEQASKLGQTFVKMVEGGAELAGMATAFAAIKSGVLYQRDYNAELGRTATQLGQNAGHLKAFAQAAEEVRKGSGADAMAEMAGIADQAQRTGKKYDPLKQMEATRARYKSLAIPGMDVSPGQARYRDNAYRTSSFRDMLGMSDEEFKKVRNSVGVLAAGTVTAKDTKAAQDSSAAGSGFDASLGRAFTTLGTGFLPAVNKLIAVMSDMASNLGASVGTAIVGALAFIGVKGLVTGGLVRGIIGGIVRSGTGVAGGVVADAFGGTIATSSVGVTAGGVAGASLAAGAALATGAVVTGLGAVAAGAIVYDAYKIKQIINAYKGMRARQAAGGDDMSFWMGQGYSKAGAAGIVSNMMRESNGDPNATGDGGHAKGLFQWHKGRRDAILKGTGIDVWNSSRADQMKAAAWEMKNGNIGFDDKAYRGIGGAGDAGSYFSSHFERPGDRYGEMAVRGRNALALASGYRSPTTVGTATVNLGGITINAPGSDAKQIAQHIKHATQSALSTIQAQADNGRAS